MFFSKMFLMVAATSVFSNILINVQPGNPINVMDIYKNEIREYVSYDASDFIVHPPLYSDTETRLVTKEGSAFYSDYTSIHNEVDYEIANASIEERKETLLNIMDCFPAEVENFLGRVTVVFSDTAVASFDGSALIVNPENQNCINNASNLICSYLNDNYLHIEERPDFIAAFNTENDADRFYYIGNDNPSSALYSIFCGYGNEDIMAWNMKYAPNTTGVVDKVMRNITESAAFDTLYDLKRTVNENAVYTCNGLGETFSLLPLNVYNLIKEYDLVFYEETEFSEYFSSRNVTGYFCKPNTTCASGNVTGEHPEIHYLKNSSDLDNMLLHEFGHFYDWTLSEKNNSYSLVNTEFKQAIDEEKLFWYKNIYNLSYVEYFADLFHVCIRKDATYNYMKIWCPKSVALMESLLNN